MSEEPQVPPPAEPAESTPAQPKPEPKAQPPPERRFRIRRSKTPPLPTIEDKAAAGDVEAVFAGLRKLYVDRDFPFHIDNYWDCMRQALDVKRLSSLDDLAETLLGLIISHNAMLLFRAQITTEAIIAESDRGNKQQFGGIPPAAEQNWLPRVAALQADLKASVKALGTFRHVKALSDKNAGQEPAHEQ